PKSSGFFTNTARVYSSTTDLAAGNNTASVTTRANAQPTISGIGARTILEDSTTGPISFTVGDVETAVGSLVINSFSSNPALVPVGNIVLGGSGASRTLTVTPVPTQFGSATITLTVSDSDGGSATNSFLLTV